MNLKKTILFNCCIILFSRIVDLITTFLAVTDLNSQEQNILVKLFNLNFYQFCMIEVLLAFLIIFTYLFSIKNSIDFKINSKNLSSYSKVFLFKKENITFFDFLFEMSYKRVLILFGSITPTYIFVTSCIFSLNNIWVVYYMKNNKFAIITYNYLNGIYFFDFIIFILPVIILIYLSYKKIKGEYIRNNL